ncbi:hypothetical protein [Deferrisoma camini]|uniref:hypothetical protein n=1 Tax=Deferrisoma camini TaxID=1035120 RepID=UPI00046C8E46|nr:hypothetical protein [Deferrisoma camini]
MQTFLDVFLPSFGATLAILLALGGAIAWVARRQGRGPGPEPRSQGSERMGPAAKGKAVLAVWGVGLVLAACVHLWLFKIPSFSGEVWEKQSFGRAGNVYTFEIGVGGETFTVPEAVYDEITKGDRVAHAFASPWTTVNGRPVVDTYAVALFGVFCGLVAAAALALTGFILTA